MQEERKSSLLDGLNAPPNLVTFSRIILVIVFLALYAKAGACGVDNVTMRCVAAVIFI
ncbi:CDP-diacylglycerol--glycerol-3-phosphate 3-phosphatidyltransferase, partial [Bifidobacterium pseudocatenulatum]|nr:CDP-diacylglycerol--glycerol-3-phosphate 3-phosphatidyltransferase [Bifidobacterium pseudocatenulatum]